MPKIAHIKSVDKRIVSDLFWSPTGTNIVLADLQSITGYLDIFNTVEMESVGVADHYNAKFVEWDPTGRFVCVVTSWLKTPAADCGYMMFSSTGKPVHHILRDRFLQFLWRPRPSCLIPPDELAVLERNLKAYEEKYKKETEEEQKVYANEQKSKRTKATDDFNALLSQRYLEYRSEARVRTELRGGVASDSEDYMVTSEVLEETVLDEHEEPL
eukprot:TRINITY_DN392_c0_g1_i1.p1 TRINITY_DN392_c0_g1~~TRINITY_DN392_c0_g1_i1.p1  ORF type:complete len:214 (+),score=57.74 TRINITY_DN392_c0_g1_i1:250-891(+)